MDNKNTEKRPANEYVKFANEYRELYKHLWWVLPVTLLILVGVYLWKNANEPANKNSILPNTEEAIDLKQPSEIMKDALEETSRDSIDD